MWQNKMPTELYLVQTKYVLIQYILTTCDVPVYAVCYLPRRAIQASLI